jgi:hypothetical protein
MGHRSRFKAKSSASPSGNQKPVAVIETLALVRPLELAVMKKVPLLPWPPTAVTTPAETVAIAVLLENHVATDVIGCPPHEAVKDMKGTLAVRVPLVGLMMGAVVQAIETAMGWVPVIDGSTFDDAVTVPVPTSCAVTSPLGVIVAIG